MVLKLGVKENHIKIFKKSESFSKKKFPILKKSDNKSKKPFKESDNKSESD